MPLLSAVAASNEGPESEELAALYDRFLLRKVVSPVSDEGVLELLLGLPMAPTPPATDAASDGSDGSDAQAGGDAPGHTFSSDGGSPGSGEALDDATTLLLSADADADALRAALTAVRDRVPLVTLPRWAALLLRDARQYVREMGATGVGTGYVSDRRLRRTAELLRSSAAAHGRRAVSVVDVLAVLPHVLWEEPEEAADVAMWVEEQALPEGGAEQLQFLLTSVRTRAQATAAAAAAASEVFDEGSAAEDAAALAEDSAAVVEDARALSAAAVEAAVEMRAHAAALAAARQHLFLPPSQAVAVMQRLLPEAQGRAELLEALAIDAVLLEMALEAGVANEALLELLGGDGDGDEQLGDDPDSSASATGAAFTDEELMWGRKEARAKLSAEDFKAWRKAARKVSKGK